MGPASLKQTRKIGFMFDQLGLPVYGERYSETDLSNQAARASIMNQALGRTDAGLRTLVVSLNFRDASTVIVHLEKLLARSAA